jgi:hypothetical protein
MVSSLMWYLASWKPRTNFLEPPSNSILSSWPKTQAAPERSDRHGAAIVMTNLERYSSLTVDLRCRAALPAFRMTSKGRFSPILYSSSRHCSSSSPTFRGDENTSQTKPQEPVSHSTREQRSHAAEPAVSPTQMWIPWPPSPRIIYDH